MAVDWFTLVAQAVNFLVLVWLLKRLFYDRIISAMDAREAGIASRLEEAARERADAEREAEEFRAKNREFAQQREQMLERATEEAKAHRQELLENARVQAGNAQTQWLETLERERQGLLQDFRERVSRGVFSLASQGLRELADADLEIQMMKVFAKRVEALDQERRETIITAIADSDGKLEVRTAFDLGKQVQDELTRTLREHLGENVRVRFTTVPELICGIELRARSHRLAWNLESWLEGLEAQVFETLDESAWNHAAEH
ncbi:F0F1 ATP synthase subunit B [Nitrosomonas sp. HPC101]|uniref:F0F1 ATP synthase subunit B family protein n=1 Tax=Nitrosomonas sp. HPC101 TaxID=1658667 RepID=UPI00136A62DC|nr:F0F1 ATP synthase subunit B [Nitrosomonas sp. HPC101]MXS85495.1 F0F1 ATP synthase subunit B [Nitrosomonas sp. HPC101]